MNLVFKNIDDSTLGTIQHTDVLETLIPAYKEDSHDIFLKHVFAAKPKTSNWQITKIETAGQNVTIFLSEAESPRSVVYFSADQYKELNYYLVPYSIVEVDFGYHSDLFNDQGGIARNTKNVTGLLPGEMHKRRPCIVLSVKDYSVQVIPLSTSTSNKAKNNTIPIDAQSFDKMAPRYTEKPSYALIDMVQTVSAYRVFPPRNANLKYEHKYHLYKLCSQDKMNIKKALAEQYNQDIVTQMSVLSAQKSKLETERAAILRANQRIKEENTSMLRRNEELETFILKIGNDWGWGESVEAIVEAYREDMG